MTERSDEADVGLDNFSSILRAYFSWVWKGQNKSCRSTKLKKLFKKLHSQKNRKFPLRGMGMLTFWPRYPQLFGLSSPAELFDEVQNIEFGATK